MHQGKTLRKYLKLNDIGVSEFVRMIERSRTQVYKYFKSREFEEDTIRLINKAIGSEWMSRKLYTVDENDTQHIEDPGRYTYNPKRIGVPVYDVDITATVAENMDNYKALEPEFYLDIPFFRDCDFAGRVVGDSMYPKFRHGAIIVCKRIRGREFIEYGVPYLIITKTDNYRMVKYLHPDPIDDNRLLLVSKNKEVFPPQPIPKEEILELYLVKGHIDQ